MLETNTQQKVEELVNIDRRVIGRWAKEANKTKINNCIGPKPLPRDPVTGKIIRPLNPDGTEIVKHRKSKKQNSENNPVTNADALYCIIH
jgi:hypothetical protein